MESIEMEDNIEEIDDQGVGSNNEEEYDSDDDSCAFDWSAHHVHVWYNGFIFHLLVYIYTKSII